MSILDSSADAGHGFLDPIAAKIKNPFNTTVKNDGERGRDFPSGFEIVEYINGVAQDKTSIKLIGDSMPMQPFPWGSSQRLTKDYYPGNPEPAVQVLGAKDSDTTIHGRFKDKHYKDPAYFGVAYEFAQALDKMCKRGNLCKFSLHGEKSWVRYGWIEKADFKMNRLSWVEYELNLFIVGETQPRNNYFATKEKETPDAANSNLIAAATNFKATYSNVPTSMPQSLAGKMTDLINGVAQNVNLVTGFVSTVISSAQDVAAAAHRALGLIANARHTIRNFGVQIDNLQHTFDSHTSSGNAAGKASDTYKNFSFIANVRAEARGMSAILAKMQSQFEEISKTLPLARYKVRHGDTLQRISVQFYGAADNWEAILTHNKLTSTVLVDGAILEIPKL